MKINNPGPLSLTKTIVINRDLTAASEVISYTGVGFKPARIDASSVVTGTQSSSQGTTDNALNSYAIYTDYSGGSAQAAGDLVYLGSVAGTAYGVVSSYDIDGFTITWTKYLSPVGTGIIYATCSR